MQGKLRIEALYHIPLENRGKLSRFLASNRDSLVLPINLERFTDKLAPPRDQVIHLAWRGGEIVGFAYSALAQKPENGFSHSAILHPESPDEQAGKRLFLQSLQWLHRNGVKTAKVPLRDGKIKEYMDRLGFWSGNRARLAEIDLTDEKSWRSIQASLK